MPNTINVGDTVRWTDPGNHIDTGEVWQGKVLDVQRSSDNPGLDDFLVDWVYSDGVSHPLWYFAFSLEKVEDESTE